MKVNKKKAQGQIFFSAERTLIWNDTELLFSGL
jgi:hypothetical protein